MLSQLSDGRRNVDTHFGKRALAEADFIARAGNELDQALEAFDVVHDPSSAEELAERRVIRMHGKHNAGPFGDGNELLQKRLEFLPQRVGRDGICRGNIF